MASTAWTRPTFPGTPSREGTRSIAAVVVAFVLTSACGCARNDAPAGASSDVVVGHHRVHFVTPQGWEHVDRGREQLFRLDQAQLSLVDLGPVTREGLVNELQAAKGTWLAGRPAEAFQRVRQLHSPALYYAALPQRANFWRPWADVTYAPEAPDSLAIGAAFDSLIKATQTLSEPTPELVFRYVTELDLRSQGREVAARERPKVHGWVWFEYETWDRATHTARSRIAFLENNGYLLALRMDRGRFEPMAPAFDVLLGSIEVTLAPPVMN